MELEKPATGAMSVADYFGLIYDERKDPALLDEALGWPFLSEKTRGMLTRWRRSLNPS